MKSLLRLDRDTWLDSLASARLDLGIALPTFASYGPPYSHWGHNSRILNSGIFYLIIGGGIKAKTSKGTWELAEGTLFMVGPGVRHDLQLLNPAQPITVYHMRLHPKIKGRRCWLEEDALYFRHMLGLSPLLDGIIDETAMERPWHKGRIQAFAYLLFSTIFRSQTGTAEGLTLSQQARITKYLREHIRKQPAPADLAKELGLSPLYFSRRFKAAYGMIPRVWLLRERLRMASLELAETNRSIYQIAEDFGYQNINLFSRQFTRTFGQSPRQFRQNHRQTASLS